MPQHQAVGLHLVLLILATIFWGFAAFGGMWWGPPESPWARLNVIGLGLFCWALSWFL
jgi:hypothetical protein